MKNFVKILIIFSFILFICFFLSGCENNKDSNNLGNNVDISKTSTTRNVLDNNNNINENQDNSNKVEDTSNKKAKETELSSFSTPLKSGVADRITNITLTCGKINEKVLKNGETFSFNQIVGPCTAEEGYKKAEIYVNKKIEFALGGGNCQVSTTLYNAALAVQRN